MSSVPTDRRRRRRIAPGEPLSAAHDRPPGGRAVGRLHCAIGPSARSRGLITKRLQSLGPTSPKERVHIARIRPARGQKRLRSNRPHEASLPVSTLAETSAWRADAPCVRESPTPDGVPAARPARATSRSPCSPNSTTEQRAKPMPRLQRSFIYARAYDEPRDTGAGGPSYCRRRERCRPPCN